MKGVLLSFLKFFPLKTIIQINTNNSTYFGLFERYRAVAYPALISWRGEYSYIRVHRP